MLAELRYNNCYSLIVTQQPVSAYGLRQMCWQRRSELLTVENENDLLYIYEYMNVLFTDDVSNLRPARPPIVDSIKVPREVFAPRLKERATC